MLAAVCIGSNNLNSARAFYDEVLGTIDMVRQVTVENEMGYGVEGGETCFWVLTPYDQQRATAGNGVQVTFGAADPAKVNAFYNAAIRLGGSDEGPPGPRDYAPGYYGAYCRDPDGNKLHIYVSNRAP